MIVKSFEDYTRENIILESAVDVWREKFKDDIQEIITSINESHIFESEDYEEYEEEEEREYTSGEKAALARDFQILSEEQLAAIYLRAREIEEESDGKYLNAVVGIENYVDSDEGGEFKITHAALADAIGIENYITVTRTLRKFRNLISGIGETSSESVYPKLIKAFNKFENMRETDIANLVSSIIEVEVVTSARERQERDNMRNQTLAARRKVDEIKTGEMVYELVKALRRNFPLARANNMAVSRVSSELGIDTKKAKTAYLAFLKSKGLTSDFKF